MHVHILGICGTFMGSFALLLKELGHKVTGSDQNVYPPMSTQLEASGIELHQGYDAEQLSTQPDLVVVGNAMRRGLPVIEALLNSNLNYTSGPQALYELVLKDRHVLAVAGTHGKTTTTTMLAWILQQNALDAGFLIGGVPIATSGVFSKSAHLGKRFFVIEADEYDSAFFDKRSKFVHYRPRTAILNNLEFDHADIFDNLAAIQKQFHHLVRTVPSDGLIITPCESEPLDQVLQMGCWTPVSHFGIGGSGHCSDLDVSLISADGSSFKVKSAGDTHEVHWSLSGVHNVSNAVAAMLAAHHVGVSLKASCQALSQFAGIKRRMEHLGQVSGVDVFDDFAHHPTAIELTLDGAKKRFGNRRIWAVIEPRSNTMRMGTLQAKLGASASLADQVIWMQPDTEWKVKDALADYPEQKVAHSVDEIVSHLAAHTQSGDVVVVMSNGSFGGLHQKLLKAL